MLDIVPALLLVTVVVFLFLLIVLNKILYKPLLNFMDNRDKSIKKDLESAGKNSNDVAIYKEEAEKIILEAKSEANKIKESALKSAKEDAMKKIEEKKSKLESESAKFLKELETQKGELRNALFKKMPIFNESIKIKLNQI